MKHTFLFSLILFFCISCKKDASGPEKQADVVYLPLKAGSEVNFSTNLINTWPQRDKDSLIDFIEYPLEKFNMEADSKWRCLDDTIIEGKEYFKVFDIHQPNAQFVRKENGVYYKRSQNEPEGIFLKDNLQSGDSWTNKFNLPYLQKEVYTVLFVKDELTIRNNVYKNVAAVQYDVYRYSEESTPGSPVLSTVRYYAANEGQIYAFMQYPLSMFYADAKFFKVK